METDRKREREREKMMKLEYRQRIVAGLLALYVNANGEQTHASLLFNNFSCGFVIVNAIIFSDSDLSSSISCQNMICYALFLFCFILVYACSFGYRNVDNM